jgi:hypothetical protein
MKSQKATGLTRQGQTPSIFTAKKSVKAFNRAIGSNAPIRASIKRVMPPSHIESSKKALEQMKEQNINRK